MKSGTSCFIKLMNMFFVYLPTILIFTLIILVYSSYVFGYILMLISPSEITQEKLYYYSFKGDHQTNKTKGYILFSIVTYSFLMCMISLLRVIFMDPGFIPEPMSFEYKILMKNIEDNKPMRKFFSQFDQLASENPLTSSDSFDINGAFNSIFRPSTIGDMPLHKNEDNILIDIGNDDNDPFNRFIGVEFTKIPLCSSCFRMKVERSHHCRQCGKCVLKMDHHCPWLATCIGYRNYKYFLLSHLYGLIASIIVLFSFIEALVNYCLNYNTPLYYLIIAFFGWICNIGLFSFLFWLFSINWRLMFKGETVIENIDKDRFPSMNIINIYDLGTYRNFTSVFRRNPLVWFLPFFANYQGNGIIFETNLDQ